MRSNIGEIHLRNKAFHMLSTGSSITLFDRIDMMKDEKERATHRDGGVRTSTCGRQEDDGQGGQVWHTRKADDPISP